jgi:hypothetical protein
MFDIPYPDMTFGELYELWRDESYRACKHCGCPSGLERPLKPVMECGSCGACNFFTAEEIEEEAAWRRA